MTTFKVKHKTGLFNGNPEFEFYSKSRPAHYLEVTDKPYECVAVHSDGTQLTLTKNFGYKFILDTIAKGVWVKYD